MKRSFNKLKLRDDFDKIKILHYSHFSLIAMALLLELSNDLTLLTYLFKMTIFFIFYKMFFKTIEKFYYTYWTLSGLLVIYLLTGFFQGIFVLEIPAIAYTYLLALIILVAESYLLYSPIFFPRVNWWEYDFRYRSDVHITVNTNNLTNIEGRLTDVRRGAGCVVLFEKLPVGSIVTIKLNDTVGGDEFKAEIMSTRKYSAGRGTNYGVKFKLESEETKDQYMNFMRFWKLDRKEKTQKKFKQSNEFSK
jgi:hypothetical protein